MKKLNHIHISTTLHTFDIYVRSYPHTSILVVHNLTMDRNLKSTQKNYTNTTSLVQRT